MKIAEPYSPEDFRNYFRKRWEILRKPWGFPEGSEIDDFENVSLHVMAMDKDDVAGVARLTYISPEEGQVRFMGVDEKYRMKNVGREIMDYIEREAMEMGLEKIVLNARENALEFYRKLGYEECGKPFDGFAGIVHTRMEKKLQ